MAAWLAASERKPGSPRGQASLVCLFSLLLSPILGADASPGPPAAVVINLRNPRPGTDNANIDAHDGPIVRWSPDAPFYRYAMSYTACILDKHPTSNMQTFLRRSLNWFVQNIGGMLGVGGGFNCGQIVVGALSEGFGRDCGFKSPRNGQTVMVHTSWDLHNWTLVTANALGGAAAPAWLADDSIIFRPAVLRNPVTGRYVLWANRLPRDEPVVEAYRRAGFIVGTSAVPEGPFEFAAAEEEATPIMTHAGGADFSLMYDPESGDAYIAYGAWHNYRIADSGWRPDWLRDGHQIAVQRLDPTSFTGPADNREAVTVTKLGNEAPSFFKRGRFFYITFGELCCFCRRGSDAKVHVSLNPLGPYQFVQQLNGLGPENSHHVPAQNSDVLEIPLASGEIEYLWAADLWFSAKSGRKGDDYQYWEPLRFVDTAVTFPGSTASTVVPVPTRLKPEGAWVDEFSLQILGSPAENVPEGSRVGMHPLPAHSQGGSHHRRSHEDEL